MHLAKVAPKPLGVRLALGKLVVEVGVDPAWRHGVASYALMAVIDRHRPCQPVQAGLGGAIGGVSGIGAKPLDGANVHDRAA